MIRNGQLEYIIDNLIERARSARVCAGITAASAASDGHYDNPKVYYELIGKAKAYDDTIGLLTDTFDDDEPRPRAQHFAREIISPEGDVTDKWEVVNRDTMQAIPETFTLEIDAAYVARELSPTPENLPFITRTRPNGSSLAYIAERGEYYVEYGAGVNSDYYYLTGRKGGAKGRVVYEETAQFFSSIKLMAYQWLRSPNA